VLIWIRNYPRFVKPEGSLLCSCKVVSFLHCLDIPSTIKAVEEQKVQRLRADRVCGRGLGVF
jgi:hypothetical protein